MGAKHAIADRRRSPRTKSGRSPSRRSRNAIDRRQLVSTSARRPNHEQGRSADYEDVGEILVDDINLEEVFVAGNMETETKNTEATPVMMKWQENNDDEANSEGIEESSSRKQRSAVARTSNGPDLNDQFAGPYESSLKSSSKDGLRFKDQVTCPEDDRQESDIESTLIGDEAGAAIVAELVDPFEREAIEAEARAKIISSETVSAEVVNVQKQRRIVLGVAVVVVIVVAVIVAVVATQVSGDNSTTIIANITSPTPSPVTPAPTANLERAQPFVDLIQNVSLSNITVDYPSMDGSPEQMALNWLIESDPLTLDPILNGTRIVQRYALATFWYATSANPDAPSDLTYDEWLAWNKTDECEWIGVDCRDGEVTDLRFIFFGLHGNIPDDLGLLTKLVVIEFDWNDFTGTIPWSSLEPLTELEEFWIPGNRFTGTLPSAVSSDFWPNLVVFDASVNALTGTLPSPSSDLWPNLVMFDVTANELIGTLSSQISNLWPALRDFYVAKNNLSGAIPSNLFTAWENTLKTLDMSLNGFTGSIPWSEWERLTSLKGLDVSNNELTGTISPRIGEQWSKIKVFAVFGNPLEGEIPSNLGLWSDLEYFDVEMTALNGTIPTELGQWTDLEEIYLSETDLSGTIPAHLENWTELTLAYFYDTKLQGTVPFCTFVDKTADIRVNCDAVECSCCKDSEGARCL